MSAKPLNPKGYTLTPKPQKRPAGSSQPVGTHGLESFGAPQKGGGREREREKERDRERERERGRERERQRRVLPFLVEV